METKDDLSSAVTELYEELYVRVGKEIHQLLCGFYQPKPTLKMKKKKKKEPSSPTKQEWEMSPWRPTPTAVKKKKKKPLPPRRPFGPHQEYAPGPAGEIAYLTVLLSPWGDSTSVTYANPESGKVALHIAAANGRLDYIQQLLQHNPPVNAQDLTGNTPLIEAAKGGHVNVMPSLVVAGADIHIKNKFGNTALSAAARNCHGDVCELLLMLGADVTTVNLNEETAMDRAKSEQFRNFLASCSALYAARVNKIGVSAGDNTGIILQILAEFRIMQARKDTPKAQAHSHSSTLKRPPAHHHSPSQSHSPQRTMRSSFEATRSQTTRA